MVSNKILPMNMHGVIRHETIDFMDIWFTRPTGYSALKFSGATYGWGM